MSDTIFSGGGMTVRLLVAAEPVTLLGVELEPRAAAGPHTHTREDETIAVVAGELVVDDGTRRTLRPGEAIFLARGVRHSFVNEASEPVRAHFCCTPGGLERFFRDVAAATGDADVAAAAERAGVVFG